MTDKWFIEGSSLTIDPRLPVYDPSRVAADPKNEDTTDWPRKGCRLCGRRDRPQFKGYCNDGSCQE